RTLLRTARRATEPYHCEQFAQVARNSPAHFERAFLPPPRKLMRSNLRLTLETEDDYEALCHLYLEVPPRADGLIHTADALADINANPKLCLYGDNARLVVRTR